MFKKGNYIVLTDHPNLSNNLSKTVNSKTFKIGYIYKQRDNSTYLRVEIDSTGHLDNGWSAYKFLNRINWRFATYDEIKLYEKEGKPIKSIGILFDNYEIT